MEGAIGLVARGAHVPFGADPQLRGTSGSVEDEVHTLTLTQHAEDGALESVGGEVVLAEVGVAQHDAVAGGRIECLDDTLHESKRYHR